MSPALSNLSPCSHIEPIHSNAASPSCHSHTHTQCALSIPGVLQGDGVLLLGLTVLSPKPQKRFFSLLASFLRQRAVTWQSPREVRAETSFLLSLCSLPQAADKGRVWSRKNLGRSTPGLHPSIWGGRPCLTFLCTWGPDS